MSTQGNGGPNLKARPVADVETNVQPTTSTAEKTQTKESQNVDEAINKLEQERVASEKEDLTMPYTHKNSITIVPVGTVSYYRKANRKVLSDKIDYLGSSIVSSQVLTSNKEEMEAYMPSLVGISPSHDDFVYRVKSFFNNIRIPIESIGKTFDISFRFNTKKDYYAYIEARNRIDAVFNSVDKSNIKLLKEALAAKIDAINNLESIQHKYGSPVNVADYLMYRHCILYPDVAKDNSIIATDRGIRFYIKDSNREAAKLRSHRNSINRAKGYFVQCTADKTIFDNVYIQYCVYKNKPVAMVSSIDLTTREDELDRFSTEEPEKFNAIFEDKDLATKSMIEMLIARGELIRLPHSQNITTVENELIGQNIKEAIVWFNDLNNRARVEAFRGKLRY